MFPVVVDYYVDSVIDNKLKYRENSRYQASRNHDAYVKGFAQNDMVFQFMEGVDQRYQGHMAFQILEFANRQMMALLDELWSGTESDKNKKRDEVLAHIHHEYQSLLQDFANYRNTYFTSPILGTLNALPKDELANLAESLVNLTSLKRKVSRDLETVGGPIDVAVISKGDGFVWIKRKHYFDADLNRAFVQRYLYT